MRKELQADAHCDLLCVCGTKGVFFCLRCSLMCCQAVTSSRVVDGSAEMRPHKSETRAVQLNFQPPTPQLGTRCVTQPYVGCVHRRAS